MAKGFKSSLFGFRKSDVINYIEEANKINAEKQLDLEETIKNLEKNIKALTDDAFALKQENERLKVLQEEYIKKYAEVEKLSEEIGKLYVSAQTDAKEIVEKSLKNRDFLNKEIEENLSAIEEMNSSFFNAKTGFEGCLETLADTIENLTSTYEAFKSKFQPKEDN